MAKFEFDLVVLGAGSGGISSAILGRGLGKKVALIEKKKIGGDCTWFGCVPSKALIRAADVARTVNTMQSFGLFTEAPVELITGKVMKHVRSVREDIYKGETPEALEQMGISVFIGSPEFIDAHTVKVNEQVISAGKFIISTGSRAFIPQVKGLDDVPYLTNETIFEINVLPKSLTVLGGGPIGIELASALNLLGVKVRVLQRGKRILPRDDEELVDILHQSLVNNGVEILTGTEALQCSKSVDGITVTVRNSDGDEFEVTSESLLVATGRKVNVEGLGLENAGVDYSSRGVKVDRTLRTSTSNIYACGDIIGSYKFSHIAEYHAGIAVPNALLPLPFKRKAKYGNIVWATFTHPELAHAGLTEKEARDQYGESITVYRYPYNKIDRARTDVADIGLGKFICDRKGKLIGIHILGERASDLLHEAQLAKTLNVPFHKIQSMIHIYPTYGDVVKRASNAAYAHRLSENFFVKLIRKLSGS